MEEGLDSDIECSSDYSSMEEEGGGPRASVDSSDMLDADEGEHFGKGEAAVSPLLVNPRASALAVDADHAVVGDVADEAAWLRGQSVRFAPYLTVGDATRVARCGRIYYCMVYPADAESEGGDDGGSDEGERLLTRIGE